MNEKTLAQLPENSEKAYQKIRERIEEGDLLLDRQIGSDEELEEAEVDFKNWSEHNEMILSMLFDNSLVANEYAKLHHDVPPRPSYDTESLIHEFPRLQHQIRQSYIHQYQKQVTTQIRYLQMIRDQLELLGEPSFTLPSFFGDDVFIVHGHDEAAKHQIIRFVENLDLKVIILGEQPNMGLTLFEKFEKYAGSAGFVIVLLTPDDIGTPRYEVVPQFRPRQNVILELGYFIGKLGHERVFPLFKGEIEMSSYLESIVYVHMDSAGSWKLKLAQGMRNVGLPVDMNNVL